MLLYLGFVISNPIWLYSNVYQSNIDMKFIRFLTEDKLDMGVAGIRRVKEFNLIKFSGFLI